MKIKKSLILMLLITTVILSGCGKSSANEKQVEIQKIPVEVMKVETDTLTKDYYAVGKLYASEEVNVYSKVKGEVKNIYYNIGDQVKAGQTLYTLENSDLLNDVDLSRSKLNKSLEDAKIKYEDALNNYNKKKELFSAGAVSENEYDQAVSSYNQAKLNYDQAQRDLDSNSKSLDSSIGDTIIKSPMDGTIAQRNIEIGEMTTSSDFVIVKLNPIIVKANVSENVVNTISVGDGVKVIIESGSEGEYRGKVTSISPIGVNNGNTYPIEIQISNEDLNLKPGMFADVYFEIETMKNQIQIPKRTLLTKGNENYVYIVEENMPKKVLVQKGETQDGYVQIQKGLKVGDVLVVKGQEYIDEESLINVVNDSNKK